MTLSIYINTPQTLLNELEEIASRQDMATSALMRDILLEYVGHKRSDVIHISEQLQFAINLLIKVPYLARLLKTNDFTHQEPSVGMLVK